jgi:hypothetical protein
MTTKPVFCNGEPIGHLLTRDEFVKLDPGKVYDDLMSWDENLIVMREDGSIYIGNSCHVDDSDAIEQWVELERGQHTGEPLSR